jgi:hypothetical protein
MSAIAALLGLSLASCFLAYVGLVAAVLAVVLLRYLPLSRALPGVAVLAVWLGYAGAMGYSGIVADPTRTPPGVFLLLAPVLAFLAIGLRRSKVGGQLAVSLPLGLIFGLQTFRIGVELTLSSLHDAGLAPRLLTLAGGNVEILVALSAPLIAMIATRGLAGRRLALAWNVVGLLSLLNVAARAMLTAPGPLNPIHAELPNVAMGMFPFTFIPGFMAPLAMALHVLAFRALRAASTDNAIAVNRADFAL